MFEQDYNALYESEKEEFRRIANYILSKTFIIRDVYDKQAKKMITSSEYLFMEKYYDIFENNSSSYIIRCDKRNCNGICPIAYFICDIADTWRRKSPSHRKYNRTGFCPWFTVECRQRTFSRSYGIRTHKHGNR